jgi:hypothetical protein
MTATNDTAAAAAAAAAAAESNKSDYEQLRARNIERNNARLRALGLISAKEEEQSNAFAWGKTIVEDPVSADEKQSDGEWNESPQTKKRPRKSRREASRSLSVCKESRQWEESSAVVNPWIRLKNEKSA